MAFGPQHHLTADVEKHLRVLELDEEKAEHEERQVVKGLGWVWVEWVRVVGWMGGCDMGGWVGGNR